MLRSFISIVTAVLLSSVFLGCASNPPLLRAANEGDVQRIKTLLNEGLDVNTKGGGWNETALIAAATQGPLEYPDAAGHCKQSIIDHLRNAGAFSQVSDTPASSYSGQTCLIDGIIEDMYISSKATRLLFGPISRIPFMKVRIKLTDADSKTVFHDMVISTDTGIYWARVTVGDIDVFIPKEVGKIIGEYINTVIPADT